MIGESSAAPVVSSGQSDVVIVGGGFAGLAAGLALTSAGHRVTVIEARSAAGGDARASFRGELVHPPGVRTLGALGLDQTLISAGGQSVAGFAAFPPGEGEPVLLPYGDDRGAGLGMEHEEMLRVFRAALASRPEAGLVCARATELLRERDRVVGVRCDDGSAHRARLVVGADGRHSRLRGLLGLTARSTLLSFTMAPALRGDVLPVAGYGNVLLGAPGPILAYPYAKGRVRMIIDLPTGIEGGAPGLVAYVRDKYAPLLPLRLREALLESMAAGDYAAAANHEVSTQSCAVPGAILIGDAAGCSHPLTATGMTTALNDVTVLVECLSAHDFSDEALLTFEKQRYRFARAREVFAHALYIVLRGAGDGPRALRDGIFGYWQGSERARRASMDVLSGDDSSVGTFLAEYARVVGISGWGAASGLRSGQVRGVARRVSGLLTTAGEVLDLAMDGVIDTLLLEQSKALGVPSPLQKGLTRVARWFPKPKTPRGPNAAS